METKKKLGIYVTSNQHLARLVKLCRAAERKGIGVDLFFTHQGCSMTEDPLFEKLADVTNSMALCMVCFQEHGGEQGTVPGLGDKDYATQERHCELIEDCTRYLNF